MSATRIQAVYRDTGVEAYRDNPFIEALPPLQESVNSAASLKSSLQLTSSDLQKSRVIRAHTICRIPDDYFQPLGTHLLLSERISVMTTFTTWVVIKMAARAPGTWVWVPTSILVCR